MDNRKASLSAMAVSYPIDVFFSSSNKTFLLKFQHIYKMVHSREQAKTVTQVVISTWLNLVALFIH